MLISRWYLSCVLLVTLSAICSAQQQDHQSVIEKINKERQERSDSYVYNHPPLSELNFQTGIQKEQSIAINNPTLGGSNLQLGFQKEQSFAINKQTSSSLTRRRSISTRRRTRPNSNTSSLEIPVQVIYDKEPTTVSPSKSQSTTTTTAPLDRTTRIVIKRKPIPSNNINKKIDIREIQDIEKNKEQTSPSVENTTSTTSFSERPRESYFKKRTELPAPKVKIIEETNFVNGHRGNFHYSYLGGDGTRISSEGLLKSFDNDKTGETVSGSVFYKDDEGNDFSLTYTADENGYRPSGAHLPTPPPIPPAIARALKYIADKNTVSPLAKTE